MKEKVIGIILLVWAIIWFCVEAQSYHWGRVLVWALFPPMALLAIGWLELHGRDRPLERKIHHHSHVAAFLSVAVIGLALWYFCHK